jgi:hypothetical protein
MLAFQSAVIRPSAPDGFTGRNRFRSRGTRRDMRNVIFSRWLLAQGHSRSRRDGSRRVKQLATALGAAQNRQWTNVTQYVKKAWQAVRNLVGLQKRRPRLPPGWATAG